MRDIKVNTEVCKGYRVQVELSSDIEEYALDFLIIYNNVKSNTELLKMYNDYENSVYVICEEGYEEETVKWLKKFGKIISVKEVTVIMPSTDFDSMDYLLDNNVDYEFLEIKN